MNVDALREIEARLTAPGAPFEVVEADVLGAPARVFKERVPSLRALLLPVAELHGVLPMAVCYGGPMNRCLARLAEIAGDGDEAQDRWDAALTACTELGARPMRARVQVESGALLLRRGDKRGGRSRIAEGVALAESLGMRDVVAAGRAHLDRART